MPQLIVIEGHEEQRRQLAERLTLLEKNGCTLVGKFEVSGMFASWNALFENAISPGLFASGRQVIIAEGCDALGVFPDNLADALEDDSAASVIIATFNAANVTTGTGGKSQKKSSGRRASGSSDSTPATTADDNSNSAPVASAYGESNESNSDSNGNGDSTGGRGRVFSKEILALNKIIILKSEEDVPPWKRREWLTNLAHNQGCQITSDAAQLLGESIESTEELRSELAKLAIYAGKRGITVRDVQTLSFDEGASAQLTFLDGVCRGDVPTVARALEHLKNNSVLLIVLTSIVNRLRPALILMSFSRSRTTQPDQTNAALAAVGVRDQNAYAARMSRTALETYGADAIKTFMMGILRLSYREKTSLAEGWAGFELLLWTFMQGARGSRAQSSRSSQNRVHR